MTEIAPIEKIGEISSDTTRTEQTAIALQGPLRRGLEIDHQVFAEELKATREPELETIFIDPRRNDQLFLPGQQREPFTKVDLIH